MTLDASEVGSPAWWMNRLAMQLQRDQRRFKVLEAYRSGRPPLAWGSDNLQSKFYRFQATSRTNFADTIVEAPCQRIGLRSIATAADSDENGDQAAWELLKANGFLSGLGNLARWSKTFGRAYIATAAPVEPGGKSVMTVEDPRQMITEPHPLIPFAQRAAFKLYYDVESSQDIAILWLPGEKWVATREHKGPVRQTRSAIVMGSPEPVPVRFTPGSFTMLPQRPDGDTSDALFSETYDDQEIPVDLVDNKGGVGEFELHTDLLDRINHMILMRVVIATLQAFRQKALKQSIDAGVEQLPERDEAGNLIDYSDVFESGPDAVWLLPPGAELWESGQADLQGILSSVKDDVLHLSATTFTPMSMFTPDAAAQTAEGAQLMRESLVFKVEDWEAAAEMPIARAVARAFRYMGDASRGDASKIGVAWKPAERYSLAEMGSAASQVNGTLTWEQTQEVVWQRTPSQIEQAKAQRAQDLILAQQQALLQAQKINGPGQQR